MYYNEKRGVDIRLSTLMYIHNGDPENDYILSILDNISIKEDQLIKSEFKLSFFKDTDINVFGIASFVNFEDAERIYEVFGPTLKLGLYQSIIPEGSRLCKCALTKNYPDKCYCSNKLILKNKLNI